MFQKWSKRGVIRFFSFNVAIIASLAILLGIRSHESGYFQVQQRLQYQNSIEQLDEYMMTLEGTLSKGIYASTAPMVNGLSANLLRQAGNAKSALSTLPVSDLNLESIYRFLSQVGNFSMSLSKKTNSTQSISDEEYDLLTQLAEQARNLSEQVSALRTNFDAGALVEEQLNSGRMTSGTDVQVSAMDGFSEIEQNMGDFPSLIYDGPFSDHILLREAKMIQGQKEISKEEAKKIAATFCSVDPSQLKEEGEEGGTIPSYRFSNDQIDIGVTKAGGFVTYLLNSRLCDETTMSPEDAAKRAQTLLEERGLTGFQESYYMVDNGICTINFAYNDNGITYYTDLVKVGIAMDNGEMVFFDGRGFLMNHHDRTLPEKKFTLEQAQAVLSKYLEVMDAGEAVIPTGGQNESYCYEFHCKGKDSDEVLVYINVENCMEEDILLLLYSDNGIFTM